jgi:hypothetical protein
MIERLLAERLWQLLWLVVMIVVTVAAAARDAMT